MALLRVINGDNAGKIYPLEAEKAVIGRESSEVPVIDQGVSRQHAEIFRIGELFFIRDLGSRNGTFLNSTKVAEQEVLRVGDRVQVGNTELVFEDRFARAADSRIVRFGDSVENPGSTITFMLAKGDGKVIPSEVGIAADNKHLSTIFKVSQLLGTGKDLPQTLSDIAHELADALNADHVHIFAFDEDASDTFRIVASHDRRPTDDLAVSRTILKRVRHEGRPILSSDAMLDDRFATSQSIIMKRIKSLICAPLMVMNKPIGAFYATNSKVSEVFSAEDLTLATTVGMMVGNAVAMHELLERQGSLYRNVLKIIATAAATRTGTPKGKAERIATHAAAIARGLGMPTEDARRLWIAGLLHDVGAMALSESELKNALNLEQRKAKLAVDLLAGLPELRDIVPAVRHHTERFDGSGFPEGLKGDNIPIEAEVVGLACTLEDLLTRGGEKGTELGTKEAMMKLRELAGKKFSTKVVNGLLIAYRRNLLFKEDTQLFVTGI